MESFVGFNLVKQLLIKFKLTGNERQNSSYHGGNTGIGKATAIGLAKMGVTVVIACRNRERGLKAAEEIKSAADNPNVDLLVMDLSSQKSVRDAVADLKAVISICMCL